MRNLYIHGGLAKTGTTSVQRYFSEQRDVLRAMGFDYPQRWTNPAGGASWKAGIAHHNIPDEILGHPRFRPEHGTNTELLAYLDRPDRLPNIVLSAEGVATCISKKEKLEDFAQFISASKRSNDNVYIVLMFRNFVLQLESWYLQKLKTGRMDKSFEAYIDDTKHWFRRLFRNIGALERTLGENVFLAVDLARPPSDSVARLLSLMNVPQEELGASPATWNKKLGLKKTAVLLRFLYAANGSRSKIARADLAQVVSALRKMPEVPDESYEYRLIPCQVARDIQDFIRKSMPDHWQVALEKSALADYGTYEAVDLSKIELTKDELSAIRGNFR